MAHECALMAGHLGIRKTLNKVVAEIFRPGDCGDITRCYRSCDMSLNNSKRTSNKGSVGELCH